MTYDVLMGDVKPYSLTTHSFTHSLALCPGLGVGAGGVTPPTAWVRWYHHWENWDILHKICAFSCIFTETWDNRGKCWGGGHCCVVTIQIIRGTRDMSPSSPQFRHLW